MIKLLTTHLLLNFLHLSHLFIVLLDWDLLIVTVILHWVDGTLIKGKYLLELTVVVLCLKYGKQIVGSIQEWSAYIVVEHLLLLKKVFTHVSWWTVQWWNRPWGWVCTLVEEVSHLIYVPHHLIVNHLSSSYSNDRPSIIIYCNSCCWFSPHIVLYLTRFSPRHIYMEEG